jgi:hypothetical protein
MENKKKWIIVFLIILSVFLFKISNKILINKKSNTEISITETQAQAPIVEPFKPVIEIPRIKETKPLLEKQEEFPQKINFMVQEDIKQNDNKSKDISYLMEVVDFAVKKIMGVIISITLLTLSFMILKNEKSSDTQKQLAFAIIGSIFGFWFK